MSELGDEPSPGATDDGRSRRRLLIGVGGGVAALVVAAAVVLVTRDGGDTSTATRTTVESRTSTTSTTVSATTSTATPGTVTPTTAGSPGPQTAPPQSGACPDLPAGSSPATFDPSAGTYAAHLVAFDPEGLSVSFDVVQWLSGDDAVAAYRRDSPDDPTGTPPNDYYIVNENPRVRSAPVRADAAVHLPESRQPGDPVVGPATVDELGAYLAGAGMDTEVFWLTFRDGDVIGLCYQYLP